jgi:Transmembrane secretion effector
MMRKIEIERKAVVSSGIALLPNLDRDAPPAGYDTGPVLVTVEYNVSSENAKEFVKTARLYGRIRRRDGASR